MNIKKLLAVASGLLILFAVILVIDAMSTRYGRDDETWYTAMVFAALGIGGLIALALRDKD